MAIQQQSRIVFLFSILYVCGGILFMRVYYVSLSSTRYEVNNVTTEQRAKQIPVQEKNTAFSHTHAQSTGAVLSLSFYDQLTSAMRRLVSLQCWAGQMNMMVVEPFVTGTSLTAPVHTNISENVQFRDVFDIDLWNKSCMEHNFSKVISWEQFVWNASRNLVLVEIIYNAPYWAKQLDPKTQRIPQRCEFQTLLKFWQDMLAPHHFRIHAKVCLDFTVRNLLSTQEFNTIILPTNSSSLDHNVTLVINEWRGIERAVSHFIAINDSKCTVNKDFVHLFLAPNKHMLDQAHTYIKKYLSADFNYTAVMIRWERLLQKVKAPNFSKCVHSIKGNLTRLMENEGVQKTFVTVDVGKHGSQTHDGLAMAQQKIQSSEELLAFAHGQAISLSDYEDRFTHLTNANSPVYIPVVQRLIAENAKCLLLVGGGTYQTYALYTWQTKHPGQRCSKIIYQC